MKKFWNWGAGIAAVYTVFAGATMGFVVFAGRQPVDLVSPDYYRDAQAYDVRQAASERALELGGAFRIDPDARGQTITVSWPAEAWPDAGQIRLYRPSASQADRRVEVRPDSQGVQTISISDLTSGNWTVQCEWTAPGGLFYAERPIVIR